MFVQNRYKMNGKNPNEYLLATYENFMNNSYIEVFLSFL